MNVLNWSRPGKLLKHGGIEKAEFHMWQEPEKNKRRRQQMKFLLTAVNAKYIHSNPAIYSLRAYAGESLHAYIEAAEYTINQRMPDILADIYKRKPDAIGFSCYIWNWNMIQELVQEIPKLLPKTDIWLGGPEVTYDADRILKEHPGLRGIMTGEGEATFRELLEWYVGRESAGAETGEESLRRIAGLCLPTGYTAVRELTDLNDLPFLYDDLSPFTNKIIYYETSRGCPYRCSYCLSSIDKKVRLRDINVIKRELQFFLEHKVSQVKFVDRTFNCDHDHAMAVWQYIHEHDNGVTNFHFEISADILREEEIALLKKLRPGLAQLEIGVQSTNEKTIHAINRTMNVDRLERIVAAIQEGGNIHLHLDLIAGLPYEDYDSFGRSFDRVYAMKPEQLQLGFLKVLKGSKMHESAAQFGICYLERPPYEVLYTKWLSYEEVLRLKRIEEMVEIYYNSSQYTHTLPFLLRAFDGPFAMFEALADFYESKGYFISSPARAFRYRALLMFAQEKDAENEDIYRELLTYDIYLRENVKSRPDFSADWLKNEEVRDTVRAFYQREEQERRYLPDYAGYDWKQLGKMTHLEPFHFPVWDLREMKKRGTTEREIRMCKEAEAERRPHVKPDEDSMEKPLNPNGICGYVLFDYQSRNPLNYEAKTQVLYPVQDTGP